jgi:hypothetical protein
MRADGVFSGGGIKGLAFAGAITGGGGGSDPSAAEHLAGVLARQAGMFERVRARAGPPAAKQPFVAVARVNVDRPLAVAIAADHPSAV